MKAIICAAGFGSRLSMNIPKAMVMVNGRRLIDYQIEALSKFDRIYVVVGFRKELIIDHLKNKDNVEIIINDKPEIGLRHTMEIISERFNEIVFLCDGDIIFNEVITPEKYEYVGVKNVITQKPIFVEAKDGKATDFTDKSTAYEWACVYQCNPAKVNWSNEYAYECLKAILPLRLKHFDLFEIDTKEDLRQSYNWIKKNKIKKFWDKRSKTPNLLWRNMIDVKLNSIKPYLKKDMQILDIGCGDCKLTNAIAKYVKSITAIDYIDRPIEIDNKITYIKEDITKIDIAGTYDLIIIIGVSIFLTDSEAKNLYSKCHKLMKQDGILLIQHQCGTQRDIVVESEIDDLEYNATYRYYEKEIDILRSAGFTVKAYDPYPDTENKWVNTAFKAFECKILS